MKTRLLLFLGLLVITIASIAAWNNFTERKWERRYESLKTCEEAQKMANEDIANDRLTLFINYNLIDNEMRQKLKKEYNFHFYPTFDFSFEPQDCYDKEMTTAIKKKYGANFIDELYNRR